MLYISGIGRSGSTLLDRTLGACGSLMAAGEVMHLFGRGMARNEDCSCGRPVRECKVWGEVIRRVEERGLWESPARIDGLRHRWTEGGSFLAPHFWWHSRTFSEFLGRYRELLGRVYKAIREVTGCSVIVDSSKNTSYGRVLLGVPEVQLNLLHLVRDSRGVVFSLGKRTPRPGARGSGDELEHRRPSVAAVAWSVVNLLTEGLRSEAHSYTRIRYTDFVRNPASVVRRVLALVGDENPARYQAHVGNVSLELGVQHLLSGNPVRSATGRIELEEDLEWHGGLPAGSRRLVTGLTFPLLLRYGYPLTNGKVHAVPARLAPGAAVASSPAPRNPWTIPTIWYAGASGPDPLLLIERPRSPVVDAAQRRTATVR